MKSIISTIIRKLIQPMLIWILKKPYKKNGAMFYISTSQLTNSKISENSKLNIPYQISETDIDEYTYVSINSEISYTSIGKFCSIGPNFLCGWGIHPIDGISTSPMFYSTLKQNGTSLVTKNKTNERDRIIIGNDVFIGANVTVLDGVTIGDGAIIGAGSVVSKDIPAYSIAYGTPIQIVRNRFDNETIDQLLKLEWWNKPELFPDIEKHFFDLDHFIEKYK